MVDNKDLKILAALDGNARATDSEIGKKLKISKQVVSYRITKLLESKVIESFYTILSTGKLGLETYYVFLQLKNITTQEEKVLLSKLSQLDYIGWLISGTGRWDVTLSIYATNISSFDNALNKIIEICGNNLNEYKFTTMIFSKHIRYKSLPNLKATSGISQTEKTKPVELTEVDKKILSELSQHARENVVAISKKTKLALHVVKYNLKSLMKKSIIEGFKPKINLNKLGHKWHFLLIKFENVSSERKNSFIVYCKQHKNTYYVTNTVGNYNLMLDIHTKNIQEFKEVLSDLKKNYADVIKNYESMIVFEEIKIDYFPKDLLK